MPGESLVDRSGYCQRQRGDGELLAPAWRKTVIYGGEIAAVLYSTAEGVGSGGSRGVPPFEISVGKSNLFNNWQ